MLTLAIVLIDPTVSALELKCHQQWSLAPPAIVYQINQCTKDCEDLYTLAGISTNCINWRKK